MNIIFFTGWPFLMTSYIFINSFNLHIFILYVFSPNEYRCQMRCYGEGAKQKVKLATEYLSKINFVINLIYANCQQ